MTLPQRGSPISGFRGARWVERLFRRLGTKLSVRSPLGNGPRGSARSRFAGAVKWPCLTILLAGGAAAGPDHADAAAAIARTRGAAPRALGCRALPRREPFMALVEAVAAGLVV